MFGNSLQNLINSVVLLEQAGVTPWEALIVAVQGDSTTYQDYDPELPAEPVITEADEVAIEGRIRRELALVNMDSVRSQKKAVQSLFNDMLNKSWAEMGFTSPLLPALNRFKRIHILTLFLTSLRTQLGSLATNLGTLAADNGEWDFNSYFAQAPVAPENLTISGISDLEITLDWDDNTEVDLVGYKVYRSTVGIEGPFTLISGETPIVNSTFTDTVSAPGFYYYTVGAFTAYGYESSGATPVEADVIVSLPDAPANLTESSVVGLDVTLDWDDNIEGNLIGYNVYRSIDQSNWTKVNNTVVANSTYTDTTPSVGNYYYQVRAVISIGNLEGAASSNIQVAVS